MTAPVQERSRRTLDRMLGALEELLKEKSFDKITIAELATRADVAVGSVYARFADKQALLVGMHRRLHEKKALHRERLTDPRTWEGRSLDEVIRGCVRVMVRYSRLHGTILRTLWMATQSDMREALDAEFAEINSSLVRLVLAKDPSAPRARVASAVEAAVRIIRATLQQRILQSGLKTSGAQVPERELIRQLIIVARALLDDALKPAVFARY